MLNGNCWKSTFALNIVRCFFLFNLLVNSSIFPFASYISHSMRKKLAPFFQSFIFTTFCILHDHNCISIMILFEQRHCRKKDCAKVYHKIAGTVHEHRYIALGKCSIKISLSLPLSLVANRSIWISYFVFSTSSLIFLSIIFIPPLLSVIIFLLLFPAVVSSPSTELPYICVLRAHRFPSISSSPTLCVVFITHDKSNGWNEMKKSESKAALS